MKNTLLFFIIISFANLQAQNNLLGEWFLHYITVDNDIQYSTIPNSYNQIYFENDEFNGLVCDNGHSGEYTFNNNNTITISNFTALSGFCNYEIEEDVFLNPYMWGILGAVENGIYQFIINGSGNNQTFTLTSPNGNEAFYGREPLPENKLPDIWYLHEIQYQDVTYENTYNPEYNIQFQTTPATCCGINIIGDQICNSYTAVYNLINTSSLSLLGGYVQNPINFHPPKKIILNNSIETSWDFLAH